MSESAVDRCLRAASAYHHRERLQRWTTLSRKRPQRAAIVKRKPIESALTTGGANAFATIVAAHLEGQFLRYSARVMLLREAHRRGIDRFEANLIIAAVQHQARVRDSAFGSEAQARRGFRVREKSRKPRVPALVWKLVAFLGIEATIVGGFWLLLA